MYLLKGEKPAKEAGSDGSDTQGRRRRVRKPFD